MKGKITKIYQGKMSRNNDQIYYRVRFQIYDDNLKFVGHAMTDLVPGFRNFAYWKDIISKGIGTWIGNVFLKRDPVGKQIGKVDADSQVYTIAEPLIPGPEAQQQMDLNSISVRSYSQENKEYKIVKTDIGWECSCPAFVFRKTCKHLTNLLNSK